MADITQILVNTQNPDQTVRSQAEQQLEQAKEANFSLYLSSLAKELGDEAKPSEVRRLARCVWALLGTSPMYVCMLNWRPQQPLDSPPTDVDLIYGSAFLSRQSMHGRS